MRGGAATNIVSDDDEPSEGGQLGRLAMLVPIVIVIAFATVALGILSSASAQPFVLTVMAILASFGTFFLLGLVAGHIQLTDRSNDAAAKRELISTPLSRTG